MGSEEKQLISAGRNKQEKEERFIFEKSLAYTNPVVASEWHPTKNSFSADKILPNSNKKVWWLGNCGHEWEAVVATRNKGSGCPVCANKKVLTGYNDIATTHPHLALEWHPTKNGDETPENVVSGNGKKYWWVGACGHEWQQTIQNRKSGNGCPYCKSEVISGKMYKIHLSKKGSLAETNPELAAQWHPTRNGTITPYGMTDMSGNSVWWLGTCGHEWKARVSSRRQGSGCPFCSNQKVLPGYNDLKSRFPSIAQEWHRLLNDLSAEEVLATSTKVGWWSGKCGHDWKQRIDYRTLRGYGCPICAKKLQTSFPEQAIYFFLKRAFKDAINSYKVNLGSEMELDIYIPDMRVAVEYDGANWHNSDRSIKKDYEKYEVCKKKDIRLIRVIEEGFSFCSNSCDKQINVHNHPSNEELNQAINDIIGFIDANVEIEVDVDKETGVIHNQYLTGSCSTPFSIEYPELLKEWNYERNGSLNPDSFSKSSGIYVWWKCSVCGNEWKQRIAARTKGVGCEKCGFIKRTNSRIENKLKNGGSLADNDPVVASEWHPSKNGNLTATDVTKASSRVVWWLGKCGHEWEASVLSRSRGNGCPVCARKKLSESKRAYFVKEKGSLFDDNPNYLREWDYEKNKELTPKTVTSSSHIKAWWICHMCGTSWQTEIRARKAGRGSCPKCNNRIH